jgi:hypothetical protein
MFAVMGYYRYLPIEEICPKNIWFPARKQFIFQPELSIVLAFLYQHTVFAI